MEPPTEPAGRPDDRFRRLEDLFLAASDLPSGEQASFLAGSGESESVIAEVAELLGHSIDADRRIGAAIHSGLSHLADEAVRPTRLGPYRVVSELGRGGLGVVYLAQRDDAQFHKDVAVKVVRPGLHSRQLERRLQRERQILAGLEHPHIARILDGGATEDGAPFLVMELVDGLPITDYCHRHELSLDRRLELFRKVCDAVHYAHRNLILHRDLKPSNILVGEGDVPKLLDFGIAKVLTESGDTETSVASAVAPVTLTGPGMRLLTPEYAAPEQVLGRPLTTGSDVYALGVLLHELLTGERPYRFDRDRPSEIEAVVCEQDPERPSLAYRRVHGRTAPWHGDLDNIVGMALRKEPERRYASALQLSEDLRNLMNDLPVMARADTVGYRMGKFIRRHRVAVGAAAVVLVTLLGAVGVTSHQANVAQEARERAENSLAVAELERQRATEVTDFMIETFELSDPDQARGETITVREALDQGARLIDGRLREDPDLRLALITTMARVYRSLSLYDDAERLLESGVGPSLESLTPTARENPEGLRQLGLLRLDQTRLQEAEELVLAAGELVVKRHGAGTPSHADHLIDLARLFTTQERLDEAGLVLEEALEIRIRHFGDDDHHVAEARNLLGEHAYTLGDYAKAERLCRRALEDRRRELGKNHPDVADSLNNLAVIRLRQGAQEEAERLLQEVLELRRRVLGPRHPDVAVALQNLAWVKAGRRDHQGADPLYREALAIQQAAFGSDSVEVADVLYSLAHGLGQTDTAEDMQRRALTIRREQLGEDHPKVVQSLLAVADIAKAKDPERAEALYREAIDLQRRVLPKNDHRRAHALLRLGRLLLNGDPTRAEAVLREAWELRRRTLTADRWETALAGAYVGRCLQLQGHTEEARPLLVDALQALKEQLGTEHHYTAMVSKWSESFN